MFLLVLKLIVECSVTTTIAHMIEQCMAGDDANDGSNAVHSCQGKYSATAASDGKDPSCFPNHSIYCITVVSFVYFGP